jgi:hypothetical protein
MMTFHIWKLQKKKNNHNLGITLWKHCNSEQKKRCFPCVSHSLDGPFGPLTISEQALIRIDSVKKILPSIAIAGYAIHPPYTCNGWVYCNFTIQQSYLSPLLTRA